MPDSHPIAEQVRANRFAVGIGIVYAALGFGWILSSDALVHSISNDPGWLLAAQRYKGLFYVIATAIGLVLLVRMGYRRLLAAMDAARSSELQVQDLFQRHPRPMWVCDTGTRAFLQVNEAAIREYGYSEREFLGMTIDDICPPHDITARDAAGRDAAPGQDFAGSPAGSEIRHRKKSGEIVIVQVTQHSVPYGGASAVMIMAADITQQVLTAQALERQEAQFRQLHQSLGEVLWLASPDGAEVLYVSPAFEQVYGRSAADFLADPSAWLEMVHPDDLRIARASDDQLKSLGYSSCEYRVLRHDGSVRWVADRKRLIVDAQGTVTMIGGIAEDITAVKERDAAWALTRGELERMVDQRTAELERVNVELEAFTRTAAHDLKSPLNGIVGFSHLLQSRYGQTLGADGARMAGHIEQSAKQMATLVNDLLALSRVNSAEIDLQPVDLVPLARDILTELALQEPARSVSFEAPSSLIARCDPGLARSLLANLLGNAWKFTGKTDPSRIRLRGQITGHGTEVEIEDNGAGFDSGHAENLFKPFRRFHSSTEFSGTGIGLATCLRIVQRHGGQLSIESMPGAGTTVRFVLPPAKGDGQPIAEQAATA